MRQVWTDITIRNLPLPEKGSRKLFDPSLPGFGIRLTARSKTWIVQTGQERRVITIGKYPQISLRDARKAAHAVIDATERTTSSQSISDVLRAFLADCETRLRPKSVEFYRTQLSKYDDWPKTEKNPHSIRALKVFANWCIDNGYRTDNPYLRLKAPLTQRSRVLTDTEITKIWNYDRPPYSDIIKILILTGQRRGQFATFNPDWIRDDCIHFPTLVMKSKRPHILPLTEWGSREVAKLKPFNGWSKAKSRIDEHTSVTGWVVHDIRRYFSTTMARLQIPLHITENILDHRSTVSGVAATYNLYNFLPEMRNALETYEAHLATIVTA